MELKIYWTDFAKSELNRIFEYYKLKASVNIARKIVKEIISSTSRLSNQPNIGKKRALIGKQRTRISLFST